MDFNPRSLAGVTRNNLLQYRVLKFQSTLPRGSDHQTNAANISSTTNFNPRSLAGATNCNQLLTPKFYISIHAPLRERPLLLSPCQSIHRISIHAPSRERLVDKIFLSEILAFQSTLPCGSDVIFSSLIVCPAPFQSTLPCGSDQMSNFGCLVPSLFQSTLPCGSDPWVIAKFSTNSNFNPRSLAGATSTTNNTSNTTSISIHAPLRERLTF